MKPQTRRILTGASTLAMTVGLASTSGAVVVDGVYDPTEGYGYALSVDWESDNSVTTGTSNIYVEKEGNMMFLYFEIPLAFKDNTWGNDSVDNTHPDYGGTVTFNGGQTGSEDIEFDFGGAYDVNVKLSARDEEKANGTDSDGVLNCNATSDCVGHEIEDDAGGRMTEVATSLDYIMNTYSVANGFNADGSLWGDMDKKSDESNSASPELADPLTYETVDSNFDDWAFHQAYEFKFTLDGSEQIAMDFPTDDLTGITVVDLFGGNADGSSGIILHASPEKSGGNGNITPDCMGDCDPFTPNTPPVPLPASFPLLLGGMAGMAAWGARRRKQQQA